MFDPRDKPHLLGFMVSGDIGPLTIYTSQRNRHVVFNKAPPLAPPSDLQVKQRNLFRRIGEMWQRQDVATRRAFEEITKRLSLKMTGYHLYVWWNIRQDVAAMNTLEHQSGIKAV